LLPSCSGIFYPIRAKKTELYESVYAALFSYQNITICIYQIPIMVCTEDKLLALSAEARRVKRTIPRGIRMKISSCIMYIILVCI
jgi:hypothetical protein